MPVQGQKRPPPQKGVLSSNAPATVEQRGQVVRTERAQPAAAEAKRRPVMKYRLDDEWDGSSINMIRGTHPPPHALVGIAPLLLLLKELEAPRFSGALEDYVDWRIAIRQFTGLLASEGGGLPEAIKLEVLNKALDETNRSMLQTFRERGGNFEGFMAELDRRYLSDVQ